jgi:hypothetical protein
LNNRIGKKTIRNTFFYSVLHYSVLQGQMTGAKYLPTVSDVHAKVISNK